MIGTRQRKVLGAVLAGVSAAVAVFVFIQAPHPVAVEAAVPMAAVDLLPGAHVRTGAAIATLEKLRITADLKAHETPTPVQHVELCGAGSVPVVSAVRVGDTDGSEDAEFPIPPHLGKLAAQSAQSDLLRVLQSGSERQRAAYLLLLPIEETNESDIEREILLRADRMLHMALESQDPVIARWASGHCAGLPCWEKSTARWAALDPDNAIPGLVLEGVRRQNLALAGSRVAMEPASQTMLSPSSHANLHDRSLAQTVSESKPQYVLPYLRAALVQRAVNSEQTWTQWLRAYFYRLEKSCAVNQSSDCGMWGDVLSTHSDSPDTLETAIIIGQSAGWRPERVLAEQATWQIAQEKRSTPTDLSCAGVQRLTQQVNDASAKSKLLSARARQMRAEVERPRR